MRARFGDDIYGHVPETFELPGEHAKFMAVMAREPDTIWIYKPSAGSKGRGIRLIWKPEHASRVQERAAIQRYVRRPYLLEQRKLHLRLYVVVHELDPLRVLLFGAQFIVLQLCILAVLTT